RRLASLNLNSTINPAFRRLASLNLNSTINPAFRRLASLNLNSNISPAFRRLASLNLNSTINPAFRRLANLNVKLNSVLNPAFGRLANVNLTSNINLAFSRLSNVSLKSHMTPAFSKMNKVNANLFQNPKLNTINISGYNMKNYYSPKNPNSYGNQAIEKIGKLNGQNIDKSLKFLPSQSIDRLLSPTRVFPGNASSLLLSKNPTSQLTSDSLSKALKNLEGILVNTDTYAISRINKDIDIYTDETMPLEAILKGRGRSGGEYPGRI
ncbi:MAG: hypothetical protein NG737_07830, partial [Omnitrophica bacterium]|nr:hypothetical protein [Candidatus Omnitrophota bacterium]